VEWNIFSFHTMYLAYVLFISSMFINSVIYYYQMQHVMSSATMMILRNRLSWSCCIRYDFKFH